ncbi:MAG: hypothetical protein GY829_04595, partial [Gammaproteobacteria bacterium]|nr:hypothetical protein [Gammaproteobacteria bacterium]
MATIVKRALRTAAGWATMSAPEKAVYDNIYYESLAAWEAAEGRNLVTADEIAELVVYNDKEWEASFTVLQVRNFPSDDTHFVRIIAHENDKFDYKLKTGAKLISNTSDTTWGFAVYN